MLPVSRNIYSFRITKTDTSVLFNVIVHEVKFLNGFTIFQHSHAIGASISFLLLLNIFRRLSSLFSHCV